MEIRPSGLVQAELKKANIGEDYWECDFQNYIGPRSAKEASKIYLRNLKSMKEKGVGLIYGGPTGSGKTTLANVTLKYLMRAGWSCYSTSLGEIVENIQQGWGKKVDGDFLQRCREVDFLLIDDVGKEHAGPTGFSQTVFDNLIRHRSQYRIPTLLTTNLTRTELKHRYGDALLSLVEGKCVIVETNAKDVRQTLLKPSL